MNKHVGADIDPRNRPTVFRQPGSLMYADNCRDLQIAAGRGEVELRAWTRGSYPGTSLGERLPGICTTGFWDARFQQNWGLKRHCNEGFKIAFLSRGSLRLVVDDTEYELQQGQFIVIRPWQLHSIGEPVVGPSRLLWLILDAGLRRPNESWSWPEWMVFSDEEATTLGKILTQNNQPVWDGNTELGNAFEAIASILSSRTPETGETRLKVALNTVMLALIDRMLEQVPALDPNLSTAQNTVSIFLRRLPARSEEDWTLELMAEECGLSRTRFADYCKLLTNMSPLQFLQHLRLERASVMLRDAKRPSITDIAMACGFNSSQYFSYAFRKRYGCTPRALAAQQSDSGSPRVSATA